VVAVEVGVGVVAAGFGVVLASCTEVDVESWVPAFLVCPVWVLDVAAVPAAASVDELHVASELVVVDVAPVAVVAHDDESGGAAAVAVGVLVPASVLVFVLDEPVVVDAVDAAVVEDVIGPAVADVDEPGVASVDAAVVVDSEIVDVERGVLEEVPLLACCRSATRGACNLGRIPQVAHRHSDTEKDRMQNHPGTHQSHASEQEH